ncbi:MAG TPA: PLP-dependent aminotransferase family protein [Hyphomicrobiales bacterium]|nr:PLP-dependent aminotransferase family protein [Hyphomicrobiales bacterium]
MEDAFSGIMDLRRDSAEPLHIQMAEQIKQAVIAGRLKPETRLPPSRVLAGQLGVSRNTVLAAIEQLKSEGILETKPGSGTRIASFDDPDLARANPNTVRTHPVHHLASRWHGTLKAAGTRPVYMQKPFQPGIPDLTSLPAEIWGTCLRRAARLLDTETSGYRHATGHPRLRRILAGYLADARGVRAEPEQIFVTSSARAGISLIVSALLEPGADCWIEEPGFRSARTIFGAGGANLIPVPVDSMGIDPSRAPDDSQPRLVYTTPSHQYPTGALMALARRIALIETVSKRGGYIIEDDFDSEFQYSGRPIAALQGLDQAECVLYLGTFSKSLLPALRVGFVVVPPGLADAFTEVLTYTGHLVSPIVQLALADFIERGHYRAHLRRMKALYAERLEMFAEGIERHSGGVLKMVKPDGGLQTVVSAAYGAIPELELWRKLYDAGVYSQPLSWFHVEPEHATCHGLLMSFASWPERETKDAFKRLSALFR